MKKHVSIVALVYIFAVDIDVLNTATTDIVL
jgi:hypothetical protein